MAGIIAGSGAAGSGSYSGVSPGAHLINLRVLGSDGVGLVSSAIEAIDWAVAQKNVYGIQVLHLSLGGPVTQSYRDDPLAQAVHRATDAGLLVVCSAGNIGKTDDGTPQFGGIVSPGNSPHCLTVGAVNTRGTPQRSDDVMTTYSSKGSTAIDLLVKPDLVAPGNAIISLEAEGSYLAENYPSLHIAGYGAAGYFQLSGTSMATAVTSATAALLLEGPADLPALQARSVLQLTASSVPEAGLFEQGDGSINVLAASQLVSSGDVEEYSQIAREIVPIGAHIPLGNESGAVGITWSSASLSRRGITFADLAMLSVYGEFEARPRNASLSGRGRKGGLRRRDGFRDEGDVWDNKVLWGNATL